ncbi:ribonuclease 3-like isoform X2 [Ostrea edulis]|uniref:ribonuclease 3-like isoform X2 n=1 Tax=Ostrea edulis TaxID=37623 RepID=UPI0024AF4F46|nr:ribonuclease 3-like isoform X2 [Ostrea edulis]
MNFFGNQGIRNDGRSSGNNVSPLANPGMMQQSNMLVQGRSPSNLQQMVGLQMSVGPNMQLFNAGSAMWNARSPGALQGLRQGMANQAMANLQMMQQGPSPMLSAAGVNMTAANQMLPGAGGIMAGANQILQRGMSPIIPGLNIQLPPPGSGLGILDTPNLRPPGMMPNIAQNMIGLQTGMFQQGISPVGQNQTGLLSSGVSQGSRKEDRDRGGREKDRSDVEDRRDRRDRGRSSRGDRSRDDSRARERRDDSKSSRSRRDERSSDRKWDRGGREGRHRERDRSTDSARDDRRYRQDKNRNRPRRSSPKRSRSPVRRDRGQQPDSRSGYDVLNGQDEIELPEEIIPAWLRCSPADLYFRRNNETGCFNATKRMQDLLEKFETDLVQRSARVNASFPPVDIPQYPVTGNPHHHHHSGSESSSSSSSESESESEEIKREEEWLETLNKRKKHPYRLHEDLWYNDKGELNDGPLCKCSLKSQKSGIRHSKYPGEKAVPLCDPHSNNNDKLFHYRITMSPPTNFLTKAPTIIEHDNHEYIFEGFSMLSHEKLENIPVCRVIRFNIDYTIHFIEEPIPDNFTVKSLDLFQQFLFDEILELVDLDWKGPGNKDHCNRFHLMPRFARLLPENGKEILSMNDVLSYLLKSSKPLLEETELAQILNYDVHEWQGFVDAVRGSVVTYPGMKPTSIRIDQLDRQQTDNQHLQFPLIIHFGIRPAQLSYAGDPNYQRTWKQYVKFKHLLNSKPKVTFTDKQKLDAKEKYLQDLRMKSSMKREVTVEISSEGFLRTGIRSDITQHAMLMPVLLGHLRFHLCIQVLQREIGYQFNDPQLLQLALTHTSYKVNYGTNPDHARNSLSNCGVRQLEYGDRKIHYVHTRKKGINILINIMSRLGKQDECSSEIPHNERLEFLGDAVVEFITSVHLFYMFPYLEEGGLTTYRAAIVQNQQLAVLAKKLRLENYMLYAHGPDLCHESDLKHAMANCFEALLGALYLDGGIELADRVFGETLFKGEDKYLNIWRDLPLHVLQEDEPESDRHWIESSPTLKKLVQFEESIGVKFDHIRLLARAFTLRSVGFNHLTLGHNQRLEFLGDTVLQLVASDYLFRHFPDHHEGHLSLLRSSLVNNRTQSIVCDDLGISEYVIFSDSRGEKQDKKTKEKADLLEAFIGALYVDKDVEVCYKFCDVCFFPRLRDFIMNQDWNDPKSQLQQCCLTLRELDGGEPDIPVYKCIESIGPTNTRRYTVAVYFRHERLSTGIGHSIQQAEMAAATNALMERSELFPILAHQKRFLERKHKKKQSGKRTGRDQDLQENNERVNKDQEIKEGSGGVTPASEKDAVPLRVTSLLDSFKERKKK